MTNPYNLSDEQLQQGAVLQYAAKLLAENKNLKIGNAIEQAKAAHPDVPIPKHVENAMLRVLGKSLFAQAGRWLKAN